MKTNRLLLTVSALVVIFSAMSSCSSDTTHPGYEYMPDMYRSPSYETNSSNPNFKDGMTSRQPVAGTVALGAVPFPFANTKEGYEAASIDWKVPASMRTSVNLLEGKRLYGIYCGHCHGESGNGDGSVVTAGFAPPPSYSKGNSSRGGKMSDLTDGKIYHTIMYGLNMMGSHASQLLPDERMKIVMYVRELQGSGTAQADTAAAAGTAKTEAPAAEKKAEKKS